ncbi:LysE family translocator [Pelagovum sp. HNIBRBA483]|uniref:LysE family translocator n=1 Tax=Pelagovum sp. HNIBRBA483 TaxID=3233341 RepID=UPI0034A37ABE
MPIELLTALMGFAFVSSITPGPNNMMLMASGANFGVRRTVPHMMGVGLGHSFMIVVLGAGLVQVFETYPLTLTVMKWVSVGYLLYLSWKIANAAPKAPDAPETGGQPFTFLQAAAFQWVNPKGWFMALTAISAYTGNQTMREVVIVAVVFVCTNIPSISFWTVLGQQMRKFLTSPVRLRTFNIVMALLLVATLIPILRGH